MNKYGLVIFCWFSLIIATGVYGQRGKIIKTGDPIMDPNHDGYVSKTNLGFSSSSYNVPEFETKMFGIPAAGGDVAGDNVGKSCGITDLIPDILGNATYAVRINNANNDLIFRFRVGDDNPSVEAWSILLDTDGLFGANDPNATANNPGFEIDITLIKNSNKGIFVYNIDGIESCPQAVLNYPLSTHFQIAIADEVTCGNPDYFYDYYVPFSDIVNALGGVLGININTGLRYAALSNVSATCAMSGKISDVSGVNDTNYNGCTSCMFTSLMNAQCPTPIVDLCETCTGFSVGLVHAPQINLPLIQGQQSISGTTIESNIYVLVQVYTNIAPAGSPPAWGSTPREQKGVYAVGTSWLVALTGPLQSFDKIVATTKLTETSVPCGAGSGGNQTSTSVTVVQPNNPPVANYQAVTLAENAVTPILLTASDADGNTLTYTVVTLPSHGTLTGSGPNQVYSPALNYFGPDSFTFRVNDGIVNSNIATVSITVTFVNHAPVANNQSVTVPQDASVAITLTGSDADANSLTYTVVSPPSHGTLSGSAPNLTYSPALNYVGSDSFTFKANDGTVDSNIATASIEVTPVNHAPIANNQSITLAENVLTTITLTGSDVDGNALTYVVITQPLHGTLSGNAPSLTYVPALFYAGPDSFTFKINDGTVDSNIATVSITVTPVNHAPIANNQSVALAENVATPITLSGSDIDGNVLTYSMVAPPAHGTLTGAVPNLTYTPVLYYYGPDNFTFKVNDGTVDSNIATVSITVTPVNQAPVANSQSVTLAENVVTAITLTGSDVDGNTLTYTVVTAPSHGTLSGTAPNITYTPALFYSGPDNFTFKVNDGTVDSNIASVSITVTPVNYAPVAIDQSVTLAEDVVKPITLTGSDVDGNTLTFTIMSQPLHGTLNGSAPNVTYTPALYYHGTDKFTFKVNDGTLDSNIGTVTITVTYVNHTPHANDQSVTLSSNVVTNITLSGSDVDDNPLTYTIVTQPLHGTLSGATPNLTYTPLLFYSGADTFTFKVNDGTVDSNIATISITVINHAPVANGQSVSTPENERIAITLKATDVDSNPLTYTILSAPAQGTLTGSPPNLTYTPKTYFSGPDKFTFKVNDGWVDSNVATVSILVTHVNQAPLILDLPILYTKEDSSRLVCLNVVDVDGDKVTFAPAINTLGGGTMVLAGAPYDFCYFFTPPLHYNGRSIWDLKVCDTDGLCGTTSVEIIVTPVIDPPYAIDDEIAGTAREIISYNVTGNDLMIAPPYKEFYDVFVKNPTYKNSLTLVTTPISPPNHGKVEMEPNGMIHYTAVFDFVGKDSFTYQVCNSGNLCDVAEVFINVGYPAFKIYDGVSPNGDGLNDYWRIDGIEESPNSLVRVFDRFNNLVYETQAYSNENNSWQGQSNHGMVQGTLPEGTYFYTIDLGNGEPVMSGYVVLKRQE